MPAVPSAATTVIPALLPAAESVHVNAILGAMRQIAETSGTASISDKTAVESAGRFMFGVSGLQFASVRVVSPDALAKALAGTALAEDALKFLAVMALIDGKLDAGKITAVQSYAKALSLDPRYLDEIVEAAQGRVQDALADMTRANMFSITGKEWAGGNIGPWITPYDAAPDPALAARFHMLQNLPNESFGKAFWVHFTSNGYAFPGEPKALNVLFSIPHDSVHVLSGYGTLPRGELLASTFTAAMHRVLPMAGHVLPVIFSWHLQVQINSVAGASGGALDPSEFWRAWAAGAAFAVDTFGPAYDFWAEAPKSLADLRRNWGLPPEGLDPIPSQKL